MNKKLVLILVVLLIVLTLSCCREENSSLPPIEKVGEWWPGKEQAAEILVSSGNLTVSGTVLDKTAARVAVLLAETERMVGSVQCLAEDKYPEGDCRLSEGAWRVYKIVYRGWIAEQE